LARHRAIPGWPGESAVHNQLWDIAEEFTPQQRHGDYTQAIMDLGATLCTRSKPDCAHCPVASDCLARQQGSQSQFPGKKPSKTLPVRRALWLLMRNENGQWLLENRPPAGLWGGLWTFPEVADKADIASRCQQLGYKALTIDLMASRRHSFSHFHLEYTPVQIEAAPLPGIREGSNIRWLTAETLTGHGAPTPVKQLLLELAP
jgi:A/G-specific adenine glycosylase